MAMQVAAAVDSELVGQMAEIAHHNAAVKYAAVAAVTLLVVDYFQTLPLEVALIWKAKWNLGKVLFFLSRYLVFFDLAGPVLLYQVTRDVETCRTSFPAGASMIIFGVAIAEVILYLRVYALSGQSRPLAIFLFLAFCGIHITAFIMGIKYMISIEYIISPVPSLVGCTFVKADTVSLSVLFTLLLISELIILVITFWLGFTKYRRTKSPLISIFYRDGFFYFLLLSACSAGNITCNLLAPTIGYSYLLATPQRVFHSVLSTRMILHIREWNYNSWDDVDAAAGTALSSLKFATRIDKRTVGEKTIEIS